MKIKKCYKNMDEVMDDILNNGDLFDLLMLAYMDTLLNDEKAYRSCMLLFNIMTGKIPESEADLFSSLKYMLEFASEENKEQILVMLVEFLKIYNEEFTFELKKLIENSEKDNK